MKNCERSISTTLRFSFIGLQEFKKLKQLSHLAVSGCELGKNELNQLRELSTQQPLTLVITINDHEQRSRLYGNT